MLGSVFACALSVLLWSPVSAKADAAKALEVAINYGLDYVAIAKKSQSKARDWLDLCSMFKGSMEIKVGKALAMGKVVGIEKRGKITCNASGCTDLYPEISDDFFIGFVAAWMIDDHNPLQEQRENLAKMYDSPKILNAQGTYLYTRPTRAKTNEVEFSLRQDGSKSWVHVLYGKIWDIHTEAFGKQSIFKNAGAAIYNAQEKPGNHDDWITEEESRESALKFMQNKIHRVSGVRYQSTGCP